MIKRSAAGIPRLDKGKSVNSFRLYATYTRKRGRGSFSKELRSLYSFANAGRVVRPKCFAGFAGTAKTLTPEKQAQLRQELQRNLAVVEAHSAVFKTVAKLVGPSVVFIESQRGMDSPRGRQQRIQEDGSGVIINWKDKFYVLTNRHVIRDAPLEAIKIDLADGRRISPERVLSDEESDVAVLAVSAPDLIAAGLGDSDKMEIGDLVLAMGSPFGLNQSFTHGIISGKGRRNLKLGDNNNKPSIQDFLQTDAAINPGNSGGPLVNDRGEVVGINTAIASNSGISEGCGFAIPINMFMFAARQLIEKGKVVRAYIGVKLDGKFSPAAAAELGLPRLMGAKILDGYAAHARRGRQTSARRRDPGIQPPAYRGRRPTGQRGGDERGRHKGAGFDLSQPRDAKRANRG